MLSKLIVQLAFKSLQISFFQRLQVSTKLESNAAKTTVFLLISCKNCPASGSSTPRPSTVLCVHSTDFSVKHTVDQ